MQTVEIYTSNFCGFCSAAKRLLTSKNVAFAEMNIGGNAQLRQQMMARSNGGHTVPQIFIGNKYVGGCDELFALERAGKLDPMLKA
jgi:glutaredoxin 3